MLGRVSRYVDNLALLGFAIAVALGSSGCAWIDRLTVDHSFSGCRRLERAPAGADAGESVAIPATDVLQALASPVNVRGWGSEYTGTVSLSGGIGTVEIGCEKFPAAIYGESTSGDYTILFGLAVSSSALHPIWLYCWQNKSLSWIEFDPANGGPRVTESAQGDCGTSGATEAQLKLPAVQAWVPRGVTGYGISGPSISLSRSGQGTLVVGAQVENMLVFGFEDWAADGGPTLLTELDAVIWDPGSATASFAVLTLQEPGVVDLSYSVTLPSFAETIARGPLTATWTRP